MTTKTFENPNDGTFAIVTDPRYFSYYIAQGWKEVTSGIDPNDLQATCDHRKYDVSTDSCAICGKDWNQILWAPVGGKPCCGGTGNGPMQYSGGKWHDSDCDTLKPQTGPAGIEAPQIDYRPRPSYRCQCGAQATSNPNCHSTWCPEHKK